MQPLLGSLLPEPATRQGAALGQLLHGGVWWGPPLHQEPPLQQASVRASPVPPHRAAPQGARADRLPCRPTHQGGDTDHA